MKKQITYFLTEKEKRVFNDLLQIWRNKKFKGGEIRIIFSNYEPQGIIYKQQKLFNVKGLDKTS